MIVLHVYQRILGSSHIIWFALILVGLLPMYSASGQFVVNEATLDFSDFDLQDGVCSICLQDDGEGNCVNFGGCTLIAAIQNANLAADLSTIMFAVPALVNTSQSIPEIVFPVKIDGFLSPGLVHIQGPGPTTNSPGLVISGPASSGSEIINIEISGYPNGIEVVNSDNTIIQGNVILNSRAGGNGILVSGTSTGTVVGGAAEHTGELPGNIIGGNGTGIRLVGGGDNAVHGNLIGFDGEYADSGNTTGIVVGIGAGLGTRIGSADSLDRNVISNSQFDGISISGTGIGVNDPIVDVRIKGNYIGTHDTGTGRHGNARGITLTRTDGILIGGDETGEGNIIAGNGDGIWLNNNAANTRVVGNTIGLDVNGDTLSNGNGVVIRAFANYNLVQDNVISGNSGDGVLVTKVNDLIPSGNTIELNSIGLNADRKSTDYGNGGNGIRVTDADSTNIGLNYIGANKEYGIVIDGFDSVEAFILENVIGFESTDIDSAGNGDSGILLTLASKTIVRGNIIGFNGNHGIELLSADSNVVEKNIIGVGVGDIFDMDAGNVGSGINIAGESFGNMIGGPDSLDGNTIAFNAKGVVVEGSGTGNSILRNLFYFNMLESIDLGNDGTTLNDEMDVDIGPNDLQNFPTNTGSSANGDVITYEGEMRGEPSVMYHLEFFEDFLNYVSYDPLGANRYLGSVDVETDANGIAAFTFDYSGRDVVNATATNALGSTSEFTPILDLERFFLRSRKENTPIDGSELKLGLYGSNFSEDDLSDVELSIESTPNIVLRGVQYFGTGIDAKCTGTTSATCNLGDINARDFSKLRATFDVTGSNKTFGGPYEIVVKVIGNNGSEIVETNEVVITGETQVDVDPSPTDYTVGLGDIYPNPFTDNISIEYAQEGNTAIINVYDVLGRKVRALSESSSRGQNMIVWDGKTSAGEKVSPGIYFIRLFDVSTGYGSTKTAVYVH